MEVKYSEAWLWSGELPVLSDLTWHAFEELKDISELQDQTYTEFQERVSKMLAEETRVEIYARDSVTNKLVGGIIGAVIDDVHYGPCFSARIQYVHPDARVAGVYKGLFKRFIAAAKSLDLKLYHTTHRLNEGVYIHKYRRI